MHCSFPFGFLSDRLYTIARKIYQPSQEPNTVYGITKGVPHAGATAWAQENHPGRLMGE